MDAIESGIVKVPRVPVDDDVVSTEQPTYLWLWDHIGDKLPKRVSRNAESDSSWIPPVELQGALESLHRSYEKRFQVWKRDLEPHGEPPPVMIVICPNTVVSKLVFDWIAGQEVELPDGSKGIRKGNLDLLTNVANGTWLDRPPTIIVDSAQLESGESLKSNFKQAVSQEIETFKREYSRRNPGADLEKLTDEDLLREVMNTVGKKGKLGETVRCVVSVSMLTEGWDANTVTHILGIRRFGSQLLCEQVVGRGLRRRSYEANAEGKFEPEYADVYGVPFVFIPTDRTVSGSKPAPPAIEVRALPERQNLRIVFPKLDGYRVEVPEEPIEFDHEHTRPLHIDRDSLALWVESAGMIGATEEVDLSQVRNTRSQHIVYAVAAEVLQRFFSGHDGALKPWLFPAIVDVTRRWFEHKVTFAADTPPGVLLLAQYKATAAEAVYNAIVRYPDARQEIILPMFRRFDNRGSTDNVSFLTRKVVVGTERSPVNYVVLDGLRGNTWEETVTDILEGDTERVSSYVKNDHLDFDIPYVHEGRSHRYLPDFLVRLVQPEDDPFTRTLIIEVSGGRKSPGATAAKAKTARDHWCTAVNNHGEWGKWGYVEIDSMTNASERIGSAIDALYADAPIIGEPIR